MSRIQRLETRYGLSQEKNACQCEDQLLSMQYIIMTPLQKNYCASNWPLKTASQLHSFYLLPFRVLRVDMCHFRRIICFSLVLFICLSNFSGYYYFLIVLLGIKRHFWRAKKTRQHRNGIGDWPNVAFSWLADEVASCCMWYGYSFLVSFKVIRAQQGKISWVVAIGPQCPIYTTIVAWLCILRLWH